VSFLERFQNVGYGCSIASWAVIGLVMASPEDRYTCARLSIALVNVVVGGLILFRRPAVLQDDNEYNEVLGMALCIPSIICYGFAFRFSPPPHEWSVIANTLVKVGALLTVVSFCFLGRSFAVFPSFRKAVSQGPYALVRHPAYLGELVMAFACVAAARDAKTAICVIATVATLILRIHVEERLLLRNEGYRKYAEHVRWRLAPGLW